LRAAAFVVLAGCVEVAPSYKIPVTNQSAVTELAPFSFEHSTDEVDDGCAPPGARDVMFEISTPISQTYVIDTGGATTKDIAISLHDGACPGAADRRACSSSTTMPPSNSCGIAKYNEIILPLEGPNTYCIVVSETTPMSTGDVALRVFAGGLLAIPLESSGLAVNADVCAGGPAPSLGCLMTAGDRQTMAAVVALCPGKSRLTGGIVPDTTTLAPAMSMRAILPAGPEAFCGKAAEGSPLPLDAVDLPAPIPFWFLVQPATTSCGTFRIAVTAQ